MSAGRTSGPSRQRRRRRSRRLGNIGERRNRGGRGGCGATYVRTGASHWRSDALFWSHASRRGSGTRHRRRAQNAPGGTGARLGRGRSQARPSGFGALVRSPTTGTAPFEHDAPVRLLGSGKTPPELRANERVVGVGFRRVVAAAYARLHVVVESHIEPLAASVWLRSLRQTPPARSELRVGSYRRWVNERQTRQRAKCDQMTAFFGKVDAATLVDT